MAFDIDKYVKLSTWLQFVGIVLAFIAVGHMPSAPIIPAIHFIGWKGIADLALGVASAGRLYNAIYP